MNRVVVIGDPAARERILADVDLSGWRVATCGSADDLHRLGPLRDVVCLILAAPWPRALAAVTEIQRTAGQLPLIAVTPGDDPQTALGLLRAGAMDHLPPERLDHLPALIDRALVRRTQATLTQSDLSLLVEGLEIPAVLLDDDGHVLAGNPAAGILFGPPLPAGRDLFALGRAGLDAADHARLDQVLADHRPVGFVRHHRGTFWRYRLAPVPGATDTTVLTATDVGEETALRQALTEARQAVGRADAARTEFMARLSRNLRTQLNNIVGFSELLMSEVLGPLPEGPISEYMGSIHDSGTEILRQLDQIGDLSLLEMSLGDEEGPGAHLFDLSPDLTCVLIDGRIERMNMAGLDLLHLGEQPHGSPFEDFVHPEDRDFFQSTLGRLKEERLSLAVRLVSAVGSPRDTEIAAVPFPAMGRDAVLITARDISEVTTAMKAVVAREARMRAIMDTVVDGIITIDTAGRIESCNQAICRIFRYDHGDLIGQNVTMLMSQSDAAQHDGHLARYVSTGERRIIGTGREVVGRRQDGTLFPIHIAVSEVRLDQQTLFTGIVRDLTEHKALAARAAYLAHHDPLTDLPNRESLSETLTQALSLARMSSEMVAVVALDITGFSRINASHGPELGNEVLKALAERMRNDLDERATAARLGADEFAIVVPRLTDLAAVTSAVEDINAALTGHLTVQDIEVLVDCDVGVAIYPRDGRTVSELMRNAETALHTVKRLPDEQLRFFDNTMTAEISRRLSLDRALRRALEAGEFEAFYQPRVEVHSRRLLGAEALVRWRHPEQGLISPGQFIPIAEENGLIGPIGEEVLRQVCVQQRQWVDAGFGLRISVNISAQQFRTPGLARRVADAVQAAGLSARLLELELTESMLVGDPDGTARTLHELKELGLTLAIDDFGTGYSSLAYLRRFPVDVLKIDRSFVMDIEDNDEDKVIVTAIISLAHNLGMEALGEGVETEGQAVLLSRLGCDTFQGFLYGRPVPAAEFEAQARDWHAAC